MDIKKEAEEMARKVKYLYREAQRLGVSADGVGINTEFIEAALTRAYQAALEEAAGIAEEAGSGLYMDAGEARSLAADTIRARAKELDRR